ncbi:MAG: hypothetical protein ABIE22_00595 [archaeon]
MASYNPKILLSCMAVVLAATVFCARGVTRSIEKSGIVEKVDYLTEEVERGVGECAILEMMLEQEKARLEQLKRLYEFETMRSFMKSYNEMIEIYGSGEKFFKANKKN